MSRVRRAEPDDIPAIGALIAAEPLAAQWNSQQLAGYFANEPSALRRACFVAEQSGELAGFAAGTLLEATSEAELENIAVSAAAKRHGIGRELLSAFLEWCRDSGAVMVRLEVRASSGAALALYHGAGFVGHGLRRAYYSNPAEDAIQMSLSLN